MLEYKDCDVTWYKFVFQNEEDISIAMKNTEIPRDKVFITSKISPYEQGLDGAKSACESILARLATEYLVNLPSVESQNVPMRVRDKYFAILFLAVLLHF